MKTVSIVIPIYNVEKYLPECLDSVINQTYKDLQIIVIDDGSTDSSGKICDQYAEKDNRITVIHQKNAGAANAKNTGLDNVKGEYLAFADSDDWVELNWIETLVNAMEKYDVDVVECGFDNVFVNEVEEGKVYTEGEMLTTEEYFKQYNENWVSVIFCNKLFKSSLSIDIRFRKERRCIDDEFYTYKVVSNGKRLARVKDILYHYRQRETSAVHQNEKKSLQMTDDALDVLKERYNWVTTRFPDLKKQYLKSDIDRLLYYPKLMMYDDLLIKKHKKISRYYFRKCLFAFPDRVTMLYSIRSVLLKKSSFNKISPIGTIKSDKKYFE